MPRRKPTARERTRAVAAVRMREAGKTYEEIRVALNYRTVGAVKMAVSRLLARNEVESVADYRRVHGQRLESLLAAVWPKAQAGDPEAIRAARPLLDSIAKLHGLDAARRHLVVEAGITEAEFAQRARELLEITGPGPLYEMAGLPPPEPPREDTFDPAWSNISPSYVRPLSAAPAAGTSPHPDPSGASGRESEAEDGCVDALIEDAEDGEEIKIIEAEIVDEPRPPQQFRVPADLVDGVPRERATGITRRLTGRYNPLAYSGYSEIIFPNT